MNFYINILSSCIPQEIGNLINLDKVYMDNNNFTFRILSTFGKLSNLTVLCLFKNQLSYPILPEIGVLKHLKSLSLQLNNLTGSIPPFLGGQNSLKSLRLYANQLSGPILEELKNLKSIIDLELSENQLNSSIHNSLGKLSNSLSELLYLDLLASILSNDEEAKNLDWTNRINLIKSVALGLSYMHRDCASPIVHQDISSKNVLLDSGYGASVSDFGTAKFLKLDSSN
ncbi:hypothetical protein LguiB_018664 [Lonicera macranthoides]